MIRIAFCHGKNLWGFIQVNDDPPEIVGTEKSENNLEKAPTENEHVGQATEMEEGEINGNRRPYFLARRDSRRGYKVHKPY
jgi:hypothetical protein